MPKVTISLSLPDNIVRGVARLRPNKTLETWVEETLWSAAVDLDMVPRKSPTVVDLAKERDSYGLTPAQHTEYNASIRRDTPANPLAVAFGAAFDAAVDGLEGQAAVDAVGENRALNHLYRASLQAEARRGGGVMETASEPITAASPAITIEATFEGRDRMLGEAILEYAKAKKMTVSRALTLCLRNPACFGHAELLARSARSRARQRMHRPPDISQFVEHRDATQNHRTPTVWLVENPGEYDANGGPGSTARRDAAEHKTTIIQEGR